MRFRRHSQTDSRMAHVDITSMIDVVFLLIIFFMTTAQFASITRAELDLPVERGEQEETSEEAGLVINITREGEIIINDETLTLEDLEQVVNAELRRSSGNAREFKLLLRADRNAPARVLNAVVERLQDMGIGAARVGTEVPR